MEGVGGPQARRREASRRRYTYTPAGKLKEVWREGSTPDDKLDLVTVDYDAFDTRIKKTTPSLTTLYFDSLYERRTTANSSSEPEHVFFVRVGGSVVAEIKPTAADSSDVRYHLPDHLGSTHLLTDESGDVLDELSYTAFGKRRNPEWTNSAPIGPLLSTIGYTGHEADEDIGLVNMRGRQYDPKLGQFIQPDPIVQAPDYSQSWNRYAYVFNNPLKFVDPTGYQTESGSETDDLSAHHGKTISIQATRPAGNTRGAGNAGMDGSRLTAPVDWRLESARAAAQQESWSQVQMTDQSASLDTSRPSTDAPGNNTEGGGWTDHNNGSGRSGWPYNRHVNNLHIFNEATKQIPNTFETWNTIGEGMEFATNVVPIGGVAKGSAKISVQASVKQPGWFMRAWNWIKRLGASDDAARGGGLVHLTNNAAGASIAQSGTLLGPGGIYASSLGTASRTGLAYTARTGLTPAGATVGFMIPQGAVGAFRQPLPIGVMTIWQRWGGTYYSAAGRIDLAAGTFTRTGVNWNQVGIYALDASVSATIGGTAVYYFGE